MKLTGAEILWESLVREGVEVAFGVPGGAVIHITDALPRYPVRFVLTRHEQGAAHAADGYARATGKVGVCLATSGPGATNLVTGLATAYMDSVPLVAITGQVPTPVIGTDAFQETDITGSTLPVTKHNYLVTEVGDLAPTIREAFYLARTGRPGPVLVDIAKDVQAAREEFSYPEEVKLPGYREGYPVPEEALRKAAELIQKAQRPLILAGHGVILSGACAELRALAERADIPVATTLLGIGAIPGSHPLSLGMAGMHGTPQANRAIQACDLLFAVGMRFDDRVTGDPKAFAPGAAIVHLDIDPAEIGKNVRVDLPLLGDAKELLSALLPLVEPASRTGWWKEIDPWREEFDWEEPLRDQSHLRPQKVIHAIWQATEGRALVVSDVGQNQMWEAQYYRHERPTLITSGGLGTMGYSLPAAIGAQIGRPEELVWVVTGDGGLQMTVQELATVVQENLPIKIAVINNGYLGMVRQWQELFFSRNYAATPLSGPDFSRLASAYGIPGLTVRRPQEVEGAISRALEHRGPILIDFLVEKEENVFPMVAPGKSLSDMIFPAQARRKG
ncbi:MAG: acetolactate synthase large subunit [Acetothermia bacterium 64_32]|nr:MAG: acetolactate synthase large subunit [Acetothermia bacterium 64_32]HAF70376.1 biosynthetic-type acetolactate synthase large subunit [Candidatus Acetothermia bacterium]